MKLNGDQRLQKWPDVSLNMRECNFRVPPCGSVNIRFTENMELKMQVRKQLALFNAHITKKGTVLKGQTSRFQTEIKPRKYTFSSYDRNPGLVIRLLKALHLFALFFFFVLRIHLSWTPFRCIMEMKWKYVYIQLVALKLSGVGTDK